MRRARSRFRPERDCPMPGTLPPPLGFWSQEKANTDDGRAANSCAAVLVPRIGFLVGALEMPRYQLVVRHFAYADVEDNEAGTELPNDAAAARESLQRLCVDYSTSGRMTGMAGRWRSGRAGGEYGNYRSMR